MIALGLTHGWIAELSQLATGSLVAAVWQGLLLAAAAGLGLRLLPKTPAAIRFAIWFGVFLVVSALPVFSLWPHASVGGRLEGHNPWLTLDGRWSLALAAVWAFASLVRAGSLMVAAVRVRELWKRATPVEIEGAEFLRPAHRVETAGDEARGLYGTRRRARLCTSDEVDRPTVIGFFSPKILIPSWLLEKLTPAELEQIVLHESGHLGRADDWMNLLQKIALVVFPLNPALAWVERRLCFERELACDERVLQTTGAPKAYAACLATLAEYRLGRRGLALALGALGRESELGQRVGRILRRREGMSPLHSKLVLGGAMLGLLSAVAGLERCPELVGFSRTTPATAAANRPRAVVRGFDVDQVVFRPDSAQKRMWHQPTARDMAAMNGAPKSAPAYRHPTRSDVAAKAGSPSRSATRFVQVTVVTSWERPDGSALVLTSVRSSTQARAQSATTYITDHPSQEIYPYAAIPVRDGWLVFQL